MFCLHLEFLLTWLHISSSFTRPNCLVLGSVDTESFVYICSYYSVQTHKKCQATKIHPFTYSVQDFKYRLEFFSLINHCIISLATCSLTSVSWWWKRDASFWARWVEFPWSIEKIESSLWCKAIELSAFFICCVKFVANTRTLSRISLLMQLSKRDNRKGA